MRERWEKFLRWVFRPFVFHASEPCNHAEAVKEIIGAAQADLAMMQAFIRAQLDRQAQIIFSVQAAFQHDFSKMQEEVCEMKRQMDDRVSQMLSLYHGKTPREWSGPLARGPKMFTLDERQ